MADGLDGAGGGENGDRHRRRTFGDSMDGLDDCTSMDAAEWVKCEQPDLFSDQTLFREEKEMVVCWNWNRASLVRSAAQEIESLPKDPLLHIAAGVCAAAADMEERQRNTRNMRRRQSCPSPA
eukprot:CAMPEP_0115840880 /NCGR_PEP_ID=MMETSP0287-20121206/7000_1 /TAXON_ID=412157 /ORGANISM="Chrysochromulina rotalis, Strain UIO044" /LENGTH=122 /DNA_ID=CAMNT_0003294507 /DNA_START=187 /DNA_END=553 /DNA_ORIENTATION=-